MARDHDLGLRLEQQVRAAGGAALCLLNNVPMIPAAERLWLGAICFGYLCFFLYMGFWRRSRMYFAAPPCAA
jgi:hypothetical protein